ncbi:vesicle-associated protein 1-2 isoform X2 [Manihot esculenta]|uniref:vesicle-associated protein 1-2 isoform X2 n=1 Tax=Manihot esculenta TaxID=3983 RepID=UPI000B5D388D|nr:vesicle-associated protein 1-2 isoform X2 [Manihot esculenta]
MKIELKKQSSCAVRLTNITHHNVAFKVKTTSPKKYCVRPNVGIILPKSTCEFTVTMQAPKASIAEKACKDKFLIQSTVVATGTTEKDITPNMFNKDDGKYIEEIKLKVALISPPESPVLSPINGMLKQEPLLGASVLRDPVFSKVENTTPPHMVAEKVESQMFYSQEFKKEKDVELKPNKDIADQESNTANDAELMPSNNVVNVEEVNLANDEGLKPENDAINDNLAKDEQLSKPKSAEFITLASVEEVKFVNDIEEMKLKLNVLESKLNEAASTISKLSEERRLSIQDRKILQDELAMLRNRTSTRRAQVGFPLLFVVMVALISILLGYLSHP